jgi:hypothetical protein
MKALLQTKMWRTSLAAAIVGGVAVAASLLTPAESALAALQHIRVGGTPVTVTAVNSHNWGSLSPNNVDTVTLKDGSRGSYWTFDLHGGECVRMTMRSDDFHPYVSLRTGSPDGTNVANHDGGFNDFARITLVNADAGTYYLLATSSGRGDKRGDYTLDVDPC